MTEQKTNICCLNAPACIVEYLQREHAVYDGCIGKRIDISPYVGCSRFLLPQTDFPENINEYDVFLIDLKKSTPIPYETKEHERQYVGTGENLYFLSKYNQTLFDSIPFGTFLLKSRLSKKTSKSPIVIIFQEGFYECNYTLVDKLSGSDYQNNRECSYTNYDFVQSFQLMNAESGKRLSLVDDKWAKILFHGKENKLQYRQIFYTPQVLNKQTNEFEDNPNVVPLLRNSNGELIAFAQGLKDEPIFFVFPQADDATKLEIVKRLFEGILYEGFSDYFPLIEESKWIHKKQYMLLEEQMIDEQIVELEKEFNDKKSNLDQQKVELAGKYGFLQKLITATGEELVQAMIAFLKWLGYEHVIDKDTIAKNVLEEDIQVDLGEKGLMIMEVKGIHRTSQDSECSQIDKIRYRRQKENKERDIYALYVVNHQRGIEPLQRQNPPFTIEQKADALSCDRGMLTTWKLFNIYKAVEEGIISKEKVRESLLQYGVISFEPDMAKPLAEPYHIWQNGMVLGIEVDSTIHVGDKIFVEYDECWYKADIVSLQQEGQSFQMVETGKTGVGLSNKLPSGKMFIKTMSK